MSGFDSPILTRLPTRIKLLTPKHLFYGGRPISFLFASSNHEKTTLYSANRLSAAIGRRPGPIAHQISYAKHINGASYDPVKRIVYQRRGLRQCVAGRCIPTSQTVTGTSRSR
jgi:hypothetical protein